MEDFPWEQVIIAGSALLASLLGYLLAGWNDSRRDRRTMERDRSARNEDRRDTVEQTRHDLQLNMLLALQDAVQQMGRLTARALHIDHMRAREGQYGFIPSDLDAELLANAMEVAKLRNRLLDADLRAAVEEFASASGRTNYDTLPYASKTGQDLEDLALSHLTTYTEHADRTMDLIGRTLRAELDWTPSIR